MEFKFNSKTRIKIPMRVLGRFRNEDNTYINVRQFAAEVGLRMTSSRFNKFKRDRIYYFELIDQKKYMLAKIMYGII
jgi:hypothetical protein